MAGGIGRSHLAAGHVKNEHVAILCDIDNHNLESAPSFDVSLEDKTSCVRCVEYWPAKALTGKVVLPNLAQRTGGPIKWDTEQAHDERDGGRGADLASLSSNLGASRIRCLGSLVSMVISCPRPSAGSADRVNSNYSEVVIRGRPRPLRGMSMSSEGT